MIRLALVPLLLGSLDPQHVLGPQPEPAYASTPPVRLVDLRVLGRHAEGAGGDLAARVQLGRWGYLGAQRVAGRHALDVESASLRALAFETDGGWVSRLGWRGPRLDVGVHAQSHDGGGPSAGVDARAFVHRDLQLVGVLSAQRRPGDLPSGRRTIRHRSAGLRFEPGSRVDLAASLASERERTAAGFDLDRRRFVSSLQAEVLRAELALGFSTDDVAGRLPSRERAFQGSLGAPFLRDRLVARSFYRVTFDEAASRQVERRFGGDYVVYRRRYRSPRSGEAARRTVALAHVAHALGRPQARGHSEDERRELRRRLAIGDDAPVDDLLALYRAEVAERNVEQAGLGAELVRDRRTGRDTFVRRAFLALPWPVDWPWRRGEGATRFLRLDYERRETRLSVAPAIVDRSLTLEAALRRDMSVFVRWRRPGRTPLDLALQVVPPRVLEVEYAYAFGR